MRTKAKLGTAPYAMPLQIPRAGELGMGGRVSYHIDKLRPRLSPVGVLIRSIIDHGYMLLREPQKR